MSKSRFAVLSVVMLVILAAGCSKTPANYSILTATLDLPGSIYSDQQFSSYMDVSNEGNRTYTNLRTEFFNTGSFDKIGSCSASSSNFRPLDLAILECRMKYSRFIERDTTERVDARVIYDSNYYFGVSFEMMNEAEMEKKKIAGTFLQGAASFASSNDEMEVRIGLSENPVINRAGNDNYIYFTMENRGNGYIANIPGSNIRITSVPSNAISECDTPGLLLHDNGIFRKITCKLSPVSEPFQNIDVFLNVDYTYELRRSGTITVKK